MLRRKYIIVLMMRAALLVHGGSSGSGSLPTFGSQDELEVTTAVGRDAVFKCTVHNIMHYQTAWLEMKKGIVYAMGDDLFTENPRISVHHSLALNGEQSWVLTIKDVNPGDAGTYMCSLNTAISLRKYYKLTVVVPPRILDANTSSDIEVREGQRARLICGAIGTPEPTYKWRREDSNLIDVSGNIDLLVEGRELVFQPALRHHSGAHLCIASNGVPPSVSKRILLSVRFEPQIRALESHLWVTLGSTVNLSCVVDAFPEPQVEWLRDYGQPVTSQPYVYHLPDRLMQVQKYVESVSHVNASRRIVYLLVNDVRKMDLMGYRCRANNTEGTSEARVALYEEQTTTTTTTTTTTPSTTSTTSTTSSTSTITSNTPAMAVNIGEDLSASVPPLRSENGSATAGGLAEAQFGEYQQQKQKQQKEMDEQWKKQFGRKTFTYSSTGSTTSAGVDRSLSSILLFLLLLHSLFLLHHQFFLTSG